MAQKDLGVVTAYGYALEGGYTGTEDDFKYILANLPSKQELLATFKRKTLSGSIVTFTDGADEVPVQALTASIEPMQSGSGDPSPTNVRAITGWTGCSVNVAGKNLLDTSGMSTAGQSQATFTREADGTIHVGGKAVSTIYRVIGSVQTQEGVRYTLTGAPSGGGSGKYRMTMAGFGYDNGNGYTFTGDGGTHNVSIDIFTGYPQSGTLEFKPMLRLATETDATYEPYKGHTVTVSFSSAGTIYGGTLDVVTGALTVTRKVETFNGAEANWGSEQTSAGLTNYYINLDVAGKMAGRQGGLLDDELLCNWLTPSSTVTTYAVYVGTTSKYLNCKCQSAADVAAFKSMLTATPLVVVYPLAAPQTYNLTAQEVKTLLGLNNMWADTGDIDVTYRVDPTLGA